MKPIKIFVLIFGFLLANSIMANAQEEATESDSTGLPGDNFSLQGALEMFKKASSPEDFEKMINSQDNHVNNLDLNGDGDIDYIRVIDKSEGNVHAFVLQVPVSETENQDIAVIELEKKGKEEATLQIVGDSDIYGIQTIVEPVDENEMKPRDEMEPVKKGGPNQWYDESIDVGIFVNVWGWPSVRFAYAPAYRPWISPWRWRTYPGYWHPWRPFGWGVWHPFHARFNRGYGFAASHTCLRAHGVYAPFRATSLVVRTRHGGHINRYRIIRNRRGFGPRERVHRERMRARRR